MKYHDNKGCCHFSFNLISGHYFFFNLSLFVESITDVSFFPHWSPLAETWIFTLAFWKKGTSTSSVLVLAYFHRNKDALYFFLNILPFNKRFLRKKIFFYGKLPICNLLIYLRASRRDSSRNVLCVLEGTWQRFISSF